MTDDMTNNDIGWRNNINGRDVQRKNVVKNVDKSSLWAPWQNGPYKNTQNITKHRVYKEATDIKKTIFCVSNFSIFNYLKDFSKKVELPPWYGQCKKFSRLLNQHEAAWIYSLKVHIVMIWSQIIYGHRTASISPKIVRFYGARTVPGRRQEESYDFYQFLDIVRCPVNFRYYLKFHGARTAFGRVI